MKVRFIKNQEPCIVYKVKNPNPVMEYDEYFEKYMECIEIEVMGLVPKELITEASHHPNNTPEKEDWKEAFREWYYDDIPECQEIISWIETNLISKPLK